MSETPAGLIPLRVEVRRDAGRIAPENGPWIRRRQISKTMGVEAPEGLVQLVDRKGETLGWGLISPESTIAIRILSYGAQPPPADWLEQRLARAFAARDAYDYASQQTTGYRMVNSEGDGLPGLVIDRYGEDWVVQITTAPMAVRRDAIEAWMRAAGHTRLLTVLPESAAAVEGFEPGVFHADAATEVLSFVEHGLRFETPAPPAQKTGAYFDQRDNRDMVARLAAAHGGALLDVGCHVGGFAIHAARAGVRAVGVDQSERVLAHAKKNAAANGVAGIDWVAGDMFARLEDPALAGPFGTIVLDPPKIATKKSNVDRAAAAMSRLVGRMSPRLAKGGHMVLCSCSHHLGREPLDRIMATTAGPWVRVRSLGAGLDHPVLPGHREGEYLRVAIYRRG